jgi:ribosomal protein S27E
MDKIKTFKIKCFSCGKQLDENGGFMWYHGDQEDMVCKDCGKTLIHSDTFFAGLPVVPKDRG